MNRNINKKNKKKRKNDLVLNVTNDDDLLEQQRLN